CLALTVGCSDNAREIFEECVTHLDESLARTTDVMKAPSLLDCLAIITFVGGNDQEETERSMDIMWRVIHPKLGSCNQTFCSINNRSGICMVFSTLHRGQFEAEFKKLAKVFYSQVILFVNALDDVGPLL
ncbi:interferon-related developmental regulator 1-like, partial [Trifolium medium]|nr:interferon-related developmental regulator 1-like [Trifolium medium]